VPLNQDVVGRSYRADEPYEVTRGKVREFATALGDHNPAYDHVAPPTFAFVASLAARRRLLDDPQLGLQYGRVVHGEQSFAFDRPIRVGDVITATCTVVAIKESGGNELLRWQEELHDSEGARVCVNHGTIVSRGTAAA
jgi:acyl dehydratase